MRLKTLASGLLFLILCHHTASAEFPSFNATKGNFPSKFTNIAAFTNTLDINASEIPLAELHNRDYSNAIAKILPLISRYLGGKVPTPEQFSVSTAAIDVPAMISQSGEKSFTVTINEKAIERAITLGVYTKDEADKALCIALFHELVHAWQFSNNSTPKQSRLEGHAVLLGTIFSQDCGWSDINKRGLAALSKSETIEKLMHRSSLEANVILKMIQNTHWRGYNKAIRLYNSLQHLSSLDRLRTSSREFLKPSPVKK